jgi:hypothetical protein
VVYELARRGVKGKEEKFVVGGALTTRNTAEAMADNAIVAAIVCEVAAEVQKEEVATVRIEQAQFIVVEGSAELAKGLLL